MSVTGENLDFHRLVDLVLRGQLHSVTISAPDGEPQAQIVPVKPLECITLKSHRDAASYDALVEAVIAEMESEET